MKLLLRALVLLVMSSILLNGCSTNNKGETVADPSSEGQKLILGSWKANPTSDGQVVGLTVTFADDGTITFDAPIGVQTGKYEIFTDTKLELIMNGESRLGQYILSGDSLELTFEDDPMSFTRN